MTRKQIRVGDELMLGNGLATILYVSKWSRIPDVVECRPHGSPEGTRIHARPEDLSRPVKIKLTKLQRDALRMARWWLCDRGVITINNELGNIERQVLDSVMVDTEADGDMQNAPIASAILSEVM